MGRNWAISIGINEYENLSPLKYAKQDAEAMAAWFKEEAKFDKNYVFLFTKDSPPIYKANPPIPTTPTFGHLRRFLRAQFENIKRPLLKPEDNLWFFFAGHGERHNDKDYLMLSDSDPGDVEHTAISVEYVTQRLRRSGADNVVLFLDACRDQGSRSRGGLGIGEEEHQGVITFYSCTANQKSWEFDELQHGSFTYTLLEGLRLQGEANCATVERLDRYLCYQVPKLNERYKRKAQNPYLKAEPPYKMYFILLEQSATLKDVEPLKSEAYKAELNENLSLAEQIWIRVLAVSRGDLDAIAAIQRIAVKKITKRQYLTQEPVISTAESASLPRGEGRETSETSIRKEEERIRQQQQVEREQQQREEAEQLRQQQEAENRSSVTESVAASRPTVEDGSSSLQLFEFDVVKVNDKGQEVNREKGQAQYFREDLGNGVGLDMVYIPGGEFMMGSPEREGNQYEKSQHKVKVQSFFMSKFQITQAQWREVASSPRVKRDLNPNPSNFKGDDLPVEKVAWEDAVEFCQRLSKQTGKEYRLPSEAEWEYACRSGTTTPFHFGETITTDLANYDGNYTYANEPKGEYRVETISVGSFPPNTFGLYDLHGNVWEWCEDDWPENYEDAPTDGSIWKSGIDITKAIRGGSWVSSPRDCRSTYRFLITRAFRDFDLGLRVVYVVLKTT